MALTGLLYEPGRTFEQIYFLPFGRVLGAIALNPEECIGSIEIPDILPIPETDVQISTRQGITLKYGTK